jgi:RecA-family ATPase
MSQPISFYNGRQRPAPDWIIPGWLKRRNTGFIIGQPKLACKSWLLLNMGWDLSAGTGVWNIVHSQNGPVFQPPHPLRVVYFTQEDTDDDVQDRVELMITNGRIPNANFRITSKDLRLVLDTMDGMAALERDLDEAVRDGGPPDLVMFDPMRRMYTGDENSSETMTRLWGLLDRIHRRYNCATLFSHHIVKPPTVKGNTFDQTSPYAARGSGDLYGGGDAFINVMAKPQVTPAGKRVLKLYFVTKRSKQPDSVQLSMDFATGKVDFDGFI